VFAGTSPFLKVRTVVIHTKFTFEDFGLLFEAETMSNLNLGVDTLFTPQHHTWIQIDDTPVFTVKTEVKSKLASLADTIKDSSKLIVDPYKLGQFVFEVKNIKLMTEYLKLCVPATYLFALFLVAAPSLQVASAGKGLIMHGSDDEDKPTAEPTASTFLNFNFNVSVNNTKRGRN
jgi:hypothetical protein